MERSSPRDADRSRGGFNQQKKRRYRQSTGGYFAQDFQRSKEHQAGVGGAGRVGGQRARRRASTSGAIPRRTMPGSRYSLGEPGSDSSAPRDYSSAAPTQVSGGAVASPNIGHAVTGMGNMSVASASRQRRFSGQDRRHRMSMSQRTPMNPSLGVRAINGSAREDVAKVGRRVGYNHRDSVERDPVTGFQNVDDFFDTPATKGQHDQNADTPDKSKWSEDDDEEEDESSSLSESSGSSSDEEEEDADYDSDYAPPVPVEGAGEKTRTSPRRSSARKPPRVSADEEADRDMPMQSPRSQGGSDSEGEVADLGKSPVAKETFATPSPASSAPSAASSGPPTRDSYVSQDDSDGGMGVFDDDMGGGFDDGMSDGGMSDHENDSFNAGAAMNRDKSRRVSARPKRTYYDDSELESDLSDTEEEDDDEGSDFEPPPSAYKRKGSDDDSDLASDDDALLGLDSEDDEYEEYLTKDERRKTTIFRRHESARALDTPSKRRGERKSTRTRWRPLEYWKGEHVVFERKHAGLGTSLPTAVGVRRAGVLTPSPKKRKRAEAGKGKKKTKTERLSSPGSEEDAAKDESPVSEEELKIVSSIEEKTPFMQCEVSSGEQLMVPLHKNCEKLEYQELPASAERSPDIKNARAAAAFVDGQIKAGVVELVPGAKKDMEYTTNCCSVFQVFKCAPKMLQIDIDGDVSFVQTQSPKFCAALFVLSA